MLLSLWWMLWQQNSLAPKISKNIHNSEYIHSSNTSYLFLCSLSLSSCPKNISCLPCGFFFLPPISKTCFSQTFFPRSDAWSVYVSYLRTLGVKNTLWPGLAEVLNPLNPTPSFSYDVCNKVRHTDCPVHPSYLFTTLSSPQNTHCFKPWYHTVYCCLKLTWDTWWLWLV